jgi:hypothetical protein
MCVMLALSSCSKVYTPALYHQDIAYMPKPASFDSTSTMVYASIGGGVRPDAYYRDMMYSGQADLTVGHNFKNFNLAYGGFAELGDYQNSSQDYTDANYFSDRTFGVVGGRFSANLYKKLDHADFRYIGIEAAYSHEFGDFAKFKQNAVSRSDYYIDPRTNLFSIGLSSEVVFYSAGNPNLHHGLRGFLGVTLGHNPLNDTYNRYDEPQDKVAREVFPKFSYFINYKHIFGIVDVGSGFMGRFGYRF